MASEEHGITTCGSGRPFGNDDFREGFPRGESEAAWDNWGSGPVSVGFDGDADGTDFTSTRLLGIDTDPVGGGWLKAGDSAETGGWIS